ncbi:P2X purinoceptor [Patescibacteria group bacterium]|nr:P2X purinoceptor [Patescibacteria group bacterium]
METGERQEYKFGILGLIIYIVSLIVIGYITVFCDLSLTNRILLSILLVCGMGMGIWQWQIGRPQKPTSHG